MILDILCPARCPICHDIAPKGKKICPDCRKKLPYIETKRCLKCGKPIEDERVFCRDCLKICHNYDEGIGIFRYEEVMRESMSYFKYKGRKEYGHVFGELAAAASADRLEKWCADVCVPVPIHKSKLVQRGYNQAEVLAEAYSEKTGLPVLKNALVRPNKTRAMKELNAEERAANLRGAIYPGASVPPAVLVIDDIYTTGATIDACAHALRQAGASRVFFLTICIGSGFMVEY